MSAVVIRQPRRVSYAGVRTPHGKASLAVLKAQAHLAYRAQFVLPRTEVSSSTSFTVEEKQIDQDTPVNGSLAVFLQLHNMEQLDEWTEYLLTLQTFHSFDLFVTVLQPENVDQVSKKMSSLSLRAIDVFHNRGMDIGGFLWQAKNHLSALSSYDAVLKLHTKTDKGWRMAISQCFLSPRLTEWVNALHSKRYGWMGARSYLTRSEWAEQDKTRKLEMGAFRRVSSPLQRIFVAGSMFLLRADRLRELLLHPGLNKMVESCYLTTPVGRAVDDWPHAFERFLLIFCSMHGDKYLAIVSSNASKDPRVSKSSK